MHDMNYLQGEVVSRKDYLKKKKREKTRKAIKKISARTWVLLAFILIISVYVFHQFYIYNTKHRLVQTLPDEISSMKEYNIYYMSESYAYDGENQLKTMSTTSSDKTTINEGLGITNIVVKNNIVYGIKNGALLKIINEGKESKVTTLVKENVKGFAIYNNEIYVYLNGKEIKPGIYSITKKNKTELVVSGQIFQMLVDKNYIYVVNINKEVVRYSKDGKEREILVEKSCAASIIQDEKYIYYVNLKNANKLYRVGKDNKKIEQISKTASLNNQFIGMNGSSFVGVYNDVAYYINTKDANKLYKSSINQDKDEIVLEDSIQILDVIDSTIC